MKTLSLSLYILLFTGISSAFSQQFISKAVIEYEVKTNVKKTMGTSSWAEMLKENMPQFKTGYYTLTFANNKSLYKFDRWETGAKLPEWMRKSDEDNSWYFDHSTGKYIMQKNVYGSNFNVEDSVRNIKWKLSSETRIIAGYNCRKATGIIMDSVYVFAFYSDEITLPGGPCSISGLPGTILGLTIPRMYISYIATKVNFTNVNESIIKPVTAKKYMTSASLKNLLTERIKGEGNTDDEDSKRWIEQLYWSTLL